MKNWYIVQSHSSFENKVAGLIKEEADKAKIGEKFEEIIVPTHDVTEVKRGKRIQRKKKYFPGYVLIKSEMDNSIYHMIKFHWVFHNFLALIGRSGGTRTLSLRFWRPALYQLSYTPIYRVTL